jgi:uncharacterized protein CbrC (UPF0167 family)
MILKVTEQYDGRLPVFNVVKEVTACDNCGCQKDVVIKSFDTYEEADTYCNALIADGKAADNYSTACGEEQP